MIGARVLDGILAPNDEDAVLDKYVDGFTLTRVERFRLMIVFAGERILSFLDEEDHDIAMDVHDSLAECILNQTLFGEKPSRPLTSNSDMADTKRESALFRIRKSNIAVSKPSALLKTEPLVGKNNLSISQLTRPGTGESSTSTVRLKPLSKIPQMIKPPGSLKMQPSQYQPFSIPFTAKQDLTKKSGSDRVLVLTSLMKRFTSAIHSNFGQPVKNSLEQQNISSLAEELTEIKMNVIQAEIENEVQEIIKESSKQKVPEVKCLKSLVENLKSFDQNEVIKESTKYQNDLLSIKKCSDLKSLRIVFKNILEKKKEGLATNVVETITIIIAFNIFISLAKSSKFFTFGSLKHDTETKKKVCNWFSKCISTWGKNLSEFNEKECIPEKIFFEIEPIVKEKLNEMKHFFSYLKFASTFEALPSSAILSMEYYLIENKQYWRGLTSKN